jgi:hypothetical protein
MPTRRVVAKFFAIYNFTWSMRRGESAVRWVSHKYGDIAYCICGAYVKTDKTEPRFFDACGLERNVLDCRACGASLSAVVDPFDDMWVISKIGDQDDNSILRLTESLPGASRGEMAKCTADVISIKL